MTSGVLSLFIYVFLVATGRLTASGLEVKSVSNGCSGTLRNMFTLKNELVNTVLKHYNMEMTRPAISLTSSVWSSKVKEGENGGRCCSTEREKRGRETRNKHTGIQADDGTITIT